MTILKNNLKSYVTSFSYYSALWAFASNAYLPSFNNILKRDHTTILNDTWDIVYSRWNTTVVFTTVCPTFLSILFYLIDFSRWLKQTIRVFSFFFFVIWNGLALHTVKRFFEETCLQHNIRYAYRWPKYVLAYKLYVL